MRSRFLVKPENLVLKIDDISESTANVKMSARDKGGWTTPSSQRSSGNGQSRPMQSRRAFDFPAYDLGMKQWNTKEIARQDLRRQKIAVGQKVRRSLLMKT